MDRRVITKIPEFFSGGPYDLYFLKSSLPFSDDSLRIMHYDTRKDPLPDDEDVLVNDSVAAILYGVGRHTIDMAYEFASRGKWYEIGDFVEELYHADEVMKSQLEKVLGNDYRR